MTGPEFKERLRALNMQQKDFCRLTDIDPSTTSRWASGRNAVPLIVDRLIEALELLTPDRLAVWKGEADS